MVSEIADRVSGGNRQNAVTEENKMQFKALLEQEPNIEKYMHDLFDGIYGDPDDPTPVRAKEIMQELRSQV